MTAPNLPAGLALAGLGYAVAIAANLDPGNLDVAAHLALAGAGALAAAGALARPSAGGFALGLGALAVARAWSATRGTLLLNWPFAIPAWAVALGLGLAASAAMAHARGARLEGAALRRGLGLAALGTGLIALWLLSTGASAYGVVGTLLVTAGFAFAARDPEATAIETAPAAASWR